MTIRQILRDDWALGKTVRLLMVSSAILLLAVAYEGIRFVVEWVRAWP